MVKDCFPKGKTQQRSPLLSLFFQHDTKDSSQWNKAIKMNKKHLDGQEEVLSLSTENKINYVEIQWNL